MTRRIERFDKRPANFISTKKSAHVCVGLVERRKNDRVSPLDLPRFHADDSFYRRSDKRPANLIIRFKNARRARRARLYRDERYHVTS